MSSPYEPGMYWGSDVPVSLPEVNNDNEIFVDMGDKGFGLYGLANNLTDADLEEYQTPTFEPPKRIG